MSATAASKTESVAASLSDAGFDFVVREGAYVYPLSAPSAGWGSTLSGTRLASVYALRRLGSNGACELVAEAELRTVPTHPQESARLFALAKEALIRQGCCNWVGRPTDLPGRTRIPVVGVRAQLRRIWARWSMAVRRRALARTSRLVTQW